MSSQDELIRAAVGAIQSREIPAEVVQYLRLARHNIDRAEGLISGSAPPIAQTVLDAIRAVATKALPIAGGVAGVGGWLIAAYLPQVLDLLKDPQSAAAAFGSGGTIVTLAVKAYGALRTSTKE